MMKQDLNAFPTSSWNFPYPCLKPNYTYKESNKPPNLLKFLSEKKAEHMHHCTKTMSPEACVTTSQGDTFSSKCTKSTS